MARKNKYDRSTRKKRDLNNVILIVCGGQTEKEYFEKFNIDLGEIRIRSVTQPESPTSIVSYAIRLRERENYRGVWCVFDKDEFHDFDAAIQLGKREDIRIAFSNQAFEYWFILHYSKMNRHIDRKNYAKILKEHISRPYEKVGIDMYGLLADNIKLAIQNAKEIHQSHQKNGGLPSSWESCTTVYELVEELLRWKI